MVFLQGSFRRYNIRGTNICILSPVDKNVLKEAARLGFFEDLVQVGIYEEVLKKKVIKGAKETAKAD